MIPHLRSAFVLASLLAPVVAQSPPEPAVERILRPWPVSFSGPVTDLACGRFVANHRGRSVILAENGQLRLSWQPAVFVHFASAGGPSGVQAIATVERFGSGPDRLAVVSAQGLHCLGYDGGNGFVSTQPALAGWIGATRLVATTAEIGGVVMRFVLGYSSTWLRVAAIDDTGFLTDGFSLSVPASVQLFGAGFVPAAAGGAPQVATVTTSGAGLIDLAGQVVASYSANVTDGKLVAAPDAVTLLVKLAGSSMWCIKNWRPSTGQVGNGGTVELDESPTGIALFHANEDAWRDILISNTGSRQNVVYGTSNGPQVGAETQIWLWDVDPATVPAQPAANLAPRVVYDIDRDGALDVLTASAATGQVAGTMNVRSQLQELVFGEEDDGGAEPTLSVETPIGFEMFENGQGEPPFFATTQMREHGLALRLHLPAEWSTADFVRAVVYPIDDATSMQAIGNYTFSLAHAPGVVPGAPTALVDIMIPLPDHTSSSVGHWPGAQQYTVELSLGTAGSAHETASILLDFGNSSGQWLILLLETFSSYPTSLASWWYNKIDNLALYWGSVALLPPGGPVVPDLFGTRFIGATVLVEATNGNNEPIVPAEVPVNNTVVH